MIEARRVAPTVRLGPIDPTCACRMLAWMKDPEVRINLGIRGEPSLERSLEWIEKAASDPLIRAFAILEEGRHVGNIVLDQIDQSTRTARLSIYIGESTTRGRGVGRAAICCALEVAFADLGLNKVWLIVRGNNTRAINAYLSVGFQTEGILREEFAVGDRLEDALRMGIFAREFHAAQAA